ncbi:hypothetical protein [Devosia ginsengisoli]|uniref:Uncharacterized protein n=1 Tax=Devosia ginsengisoli TaxID=400770 RepID=A0A5B8LMA7_9HYPH|nr:hypothetical protein [Devosia ginsengisoli]QDZ09387.1 hypothetical protein FPZ08_00670 [Devosia ginsengisoli]
MTPQTLTPELLETRSRQLDDRIGKRNRWEYLAGLIGGVATLVLGLFVLLSGPLDPPAITTGAGFLLLAAGSVVAMLQLHRRTGGGTSITGATAILASYRAELVRQRDALRSVLLWYVLPFIPGFLLIYSAALFTPGGSAWGALIPAGITLAFLAWVYHANRKAADCIDTEIDELDRRAHG